MFSIKYQNHNFYMEGELHFNVNILTQTINYFFDLNIFDKETFFLTEEVDSLDLKLFDKNKYLIIKFNKDNNLKEINLPLKDEYFIKKIINIFRRFFYVFDKFIILIKLKDDIIDIENNNFNFNPNYLNTNPEILFNFCLISKKFELANHIFINSNIRYNDNCIIDLFSSKNTNLINNYLKKHSFATLNFLIANLYIEEYYDEIKKTEEFNLNKDFIRNLIIKNGILIAKSFKERVNTEIEIDNF